MKIRKRPFACFLTLMAITLAFFSTPSWAQEQQADTEKLLAEIAGNYEFEYEGQYMVFVFTVEDGNLMGSPEGEAAEVMEPVEGEEMTYVGYSPDGTEYQFKFSKDEEGKVSKCLCIVPAMGIEIEGLKIKG